MKHPVVSALIAFGVVVLGLLIAGAMTSGDTRIEETAVLNGSPDRVWPFFGDLRGWPVWYRAKDGIPRMTASVLTEGTASGMNAVRHAEDSFGYWWEEKVTTYEPGHRLVLEGTVTPQRFGWRQEITLTALPDDKVKVTWILEYSVKGPIVKLLNKSRNEENFRLYMRDGMQNINPMVPTKEEWGDQEIVTEELFTPGKLETISAEEKAATK